MTETRPNGGKPRVLLTGAAGQIGRFLMTPFAERYTLRTFDIRPLPESLDHRIGDLQDVAALQSAMEGVDVLVHLAATPNEAPFVEVLVPNNVIGLYNTLEAARSAGVRRVVFASTCQTVTGYSNNGNDGAHTIRTTDPPRPLSLYGATKAFGETMGRWYYDTHALEFIGVRIGWFVPYDGPQVNRAVTDLWLSPLDAVQLFVRAVEQEGVGYAIVFGTSVTDHEVLDRAPGRELLGFEPQDSAASLAKRAEQ